MKLWTGALLMAFGAILAASVMLMLARPVAAPETVPAKTAATGEGLSIDADTQKRLGIKLVALTMATAPVVEQGYARALDVAALAAIDGDITIARAASAASDAELARLSALAAADQSASTRSVQVARAQAVTDRSRIGQAVQRVGLEFGPGLAALDDPARTRLVADVASGRAALLRIDFPGGPPPTGALIQVGNGRAKVLGAAAAADARLQVSGVLAVLRGPLVSEAGAGRLLPASRTTTTTEAGVIVPRSAVLRRHGRLWAYRLTSPGQFMRAEMTDARQTATGWFTAAGLAAGDQIAVAGAGALLAAESGGEASADVEAD